MEIYDDLERFKQKIQQNIHFQQFEPSRSHELAAGNYPIFNQLNEHFTTQAQVHSCIEQVSDVEADTQTSFDSTFVKQQVAETLDVAIFDSVSKISSRQSLDRLLHSAGLGGERKSAYTPALAGNDGCL